MKPILNNVAVESRALSLSQSHLVTWLTWWVLKVDPYRESLSWSLSADHQPEGLRPEHMEIYGDSWKQFVSLFVPYIHMSTQF